MWRRRGSYLRGIAALVALALVSGCGGNSTKGTATSKASETPSIASLHRPTHAPHRATVHVTTTAEKGDGSLVSRYSCAGADISPELHWILPEGVSATTKEILVFVRTINEKGVVTNWAVAGIGPHVDHLSAGRLPAGAVVGRNSFGTTDYHLCPTSEAVITMGVYALPKTIVESPGFDPETLRGELEEPTVQWGGAEIFFH